MSRPLPQSALARRALVATPSVWSRHRVRRAGLVVGVTVLGLGLAGSVAVTGNAEHVSAAAGAAVAAPHSVAAPQPVATPGRPSVSAVPGVSAPSAFDRRAAQVSRDARRPALDKAAVEQSGGQRANALALASGKARLQAESDAVEARRVSLAAAAKATSKKAHQIAAHRAAVKKKKAEARARAKARAKARARAEAQAEAKAKASRRRAHRASLPVTSGFHIAARFGDTGSWSRYHTGIDFAAPMGTQVHAAAAGEVTHAGPGDAGWAGHYVTIRHADGKSTLYAHMSTVTVSAGEHVDAGDRVGNIGMTGRSFGPHVHFELYPAGVKPGDLYHAINPAPWLHDRGLHY